VTLQAAHRAAGGHAAATAGAWLLTGVANTALWTWVPFVLLAAGISWRLLLPGGLLMGLAAVPMFFAGRLYMPSALRHADRQFGDLGVAFTCIGWLFAVSFVLVVTTVVGAVVAREPGPASRLLSRRSAATPTAGLGSGEGLSYGTSDAGWRRAVEDRNLEERPTGPTAGAE